MRQGPAPQTQNQSKDLPSTGRWKGVLYALAASVGFTCMGVCTKAGLRGVEGAAVSSIELVFWRSVIVSIVSGFLAWKRGVSLRPVGLKWMSIRVGLGVVAMLFFFDAIAAVGLGLATTLLYTHPVWTALFGHRILSEHLPRGALIFCLIAFLGLVFMVGPDVARLDLGALFGLGAGALAAFSYMSVRALRNTDPPERIVFLFAFISALVTAPWAIPDAIAHTEARTWTTWLVVLGVGLSGTCGQIFITQALAYEKAGVVGVLSYTTVLMSFLCGVLLWNEPLSLGAAFGAVCVVSGGAALTWLRSQETQPEPT